MLICLCFSKISVSIGNFEAFDVGPFIFGVDNIKILRQFNNQVWRFARCFWKSSITLRLLLYTKVYSKLSWHWKRSSWIILRSSNIKRSGNLSTISAMQCVFTVWSMSWFGLFHTSGVAKCFHTSLQ